MRLTRDEMYLGIAHVVAKRSSCRRAQVGAVVAYDAEILGIGYNGSPKGLPHCEEGTCEPLGDRCQATVHAEVNALLKSGYRAGATLYVTHLPCENCAKVIINSGVTQVLYAQTYGSDLKGLALLKEAGLDVQKFRGFV